MAGRSCHDGLRRIKKKGLCGTVVICGLCVEELFGPCIVVLFGMCMTDLFKGRLSFVH